MSPYPLLYCQVDLLAHNWKNVFNLGIGKAEDFYIVFLQNGRPFFIIGLPLCCFVMRAVYLDYQFCGMTIKIGDESGDDFLALETDWIKPQKIVPQPVFLWSRLLSQLPGAGDQLPFVGQ